MTFSTEAPLSGQAGFRNSNSVKWFLAHLPRPLAWSCDTIGSWWSQQEYVVGFSFEVDWKCTWWKWYIAKYRRSSTFGHYTFVCRIRTPLTNKHFYLSHSGAVKL